MTDATPFERTIASLQTAMTVAHIAESPLIAADSHETVASVRSWASLNTLNNIPVIRNGSIVGVLENINGDVVGVATPADHLQAGQANRSLTGDMLVEGECPLDGFIASLLGPPHYRLVLRGGVLDAIVTPSDLNKPAVRMLAYASVAHLEAVMTSAIRVRLGNEDPLVHLDPSSGDQVRGSYRRLKDKLLNPSPLAVMSIQQKATVLARLGVFRDPLEEVEADFRLIYERLRNPLMHSDDYVGDSLESLQGFADILERVRTRTRVASVM